MNAHRYSQKVGALLSLLILLGGLLACAQESSGPKAWIDFPAEGMSVPMGSDVSVISHAYARQGVAEVMLSVDGQPYRRDASPDSGATFIQLTQTWRPVEEGVYTLQVTTYAADGEVSSPAIVNVEVVGAVVEAPGPAPSSPTPTWTPIVVQPITPTITPTPTSTPLTPVPITPTPITPTPLTPTPITPMPITPTPITPTPITPTPVTPPPPESEVRLWADAESVQAGSCTTVHWHVSNVSAYWVNGEDGVGDDGQFQACPCQDEAHTLRAVLRDGSEQNLSVTIRVIGQCITPPPPPQEVAVPSPNTPRDGAELDCLSSQPLVWVSIEAPGGSVRYYVKLEQERGGQWQSVRGWGPESGKQVEASVECGYRYRWAVRAEDGAGNFSAWSSWSQFMVTGETPQPPPEEMVVPVPSPAVPQDGSEVGCRTTQTLQWVPVEPPGGSVRYNVKLEWLLQDQWQSVRGWGPESGKQVEAGVECGMRYRWAVRAEDGVGNLSDWSSWSSFTVTLN
jgi:hypothetical protein